jgi:hypothetical protein
LLDVPDSIIDGSDDEAPLELHGSSRAQDFAVKQFVNQEAFEGSDVALPLANLEGVHADDLAVLCEKGILSSTVDEFGDPTFQLVPSAIRLGGGTRTRGAHITMTNVPGIGLTFA